MIRLYGTLDASLVTLDVVDFAWGELKVPKGNTTINLVVISGVYRAVFNCSENVLALISLKLFFSFLSSAKENLPPIEPGWFTEGALSNMNNVDLDITSGKRHAR